MNNYEYTPAHTSTVTTMSKVGKVTVPQTRTIHHPDEYRIVLQCENNDMSFLLTYFIHKEDYKKYDVGQQIEIDSSWAPYGYEVLMNNQENEEKK